MELWELKVLLTEQKKLVASKLLDGTYIYNNESTDDSLKSLPINKEKFINRALEARYPDDVSVLDKYLPKS